MTRLFTLVLLCVLAGCTSVVDGLPELSAEEMAKVESGCGGAWIIADRGAGLVDEPTVSAKTCAEFWLGRGEPGYPYLYQYLTESCWRTAPRSERRRRSIWSFDYRDCFDRAATNREMARWVRATTLVRFSCLAWLLQNPGRLEEGFCTFFEKAYGENDTIRNFIQSYVSKLNEAKGSVADEPCANDGHSRPEPYPFPVQKLVGSERPAEEHFLARLSSLGFECKSKEGDFGRDRYCSVGALITHWSRSDYYFSMPFTLGFAGLTFGLEYGVNPDDGRVENVCYSVFAMSI